MSQDPHDIHCYSPKPVAAQEPIAWLHDGEGRFDAIHTKVKETLDASFHIYGFAGRIDRPAVNTAEHYTIPLYDHAAPCARCAEAERIEAEATAKLGEEIIKNGTLQDNVAKQAAEIERLSSHVEDAKEIIQKMMKVEKQQADRINALEAFVQKLEHANTEAANETISLRRKLVATEAKLAKADAVIEADRLAFKHMDAKGGLGYSVHELIGRNLAAIEQYQKGE